MQCLHGRSTQTVDGDRANLNWQTRKQRCVTRNVKALFKGLLHTAPINVFNLFWIDLWVARQNAFHQMC
ncbi:Uncharacterised protein [Vibrio cholerae]|uniref:Uncharacterized protein n=1 Tax=Vibrio cholerae TaxID=666 RepID=A0A655RIY5_VIBCL|nr:Uncharacterised protein [Vibrio cholerae]CSB01081.1 Uncharacterised protein [Vibrio cholerae]CSB41290.1 Uncharacterised protein [Vibrio cholerae]CSB87958.1 Uncharacterised protein [Vibrio cholerae]CSC14412.1 Uncharacterised protein [Vibrio cholerae]